MEGSPLRSPKSLRRTIGAKVRRESEEQKTGDCLPAEVPKGEQPKSNVCIKGTEYADVFSSMKVIVQKYALINKVAGDVTPFHRPTDLDRIFMDVTAFLMCVLLHEKRHMPRLCQNITLSNICDESVNKGRMTGTKGRGTGT